MIGRGTDSEEVIRQRIERAKEEIALMREYDYAVVNDEVPLAAERVKRIIEAEHFRVDRVIGRYDENDSRANSRTIIEREENRIMMLKPSIDTLLDKVPSKYSLVILEAKRAHELEAERKPRSLLQLNLPFVLWRRLNLEMWSFTQIQSKREAVRRRAEEAKRLAEEEERKIKAQIAKEKEVGEKFKYKTRLAYHPGFFSLSD